MWKKENERANSSTALVVFEENRLMSVRSDNDHPDNGTGCGSGSFHCSIVPCGMQLLGLRVQGSIEPFKETSPTSPKGNGPGYSEGSMERRGGRKKRALPKMEVDTFGIKQQ